MNIIESMKKARKLKDTESNPEYEGLPLNERQPHREIHISHDEFGINSVKTGVGDIGRARVHYKVVEKGRDGIILHIHKFEQDDKNNEEKNVYLDGNFVTASQAIKAFSRSNLFPNSEAIKG